MEEGNTDRNDHHELLLFGQGASPSIIAVPTPATSQQSLLVQEGVAYAGSLFRFPVQFPQALPPARNSVLSTRGRADLPVHIVVLDDADSSEHLSRPAWLSWLQWEEGTRELWGQVPAQIQFTARIPIAILAHPATDTGATIGAAPDSNQHLLNTPPTNRAKPGSSAYEPSSSPASVSSSTDSSTPRVHQGETFPPNASTCTPMAGESVVVAKVLLELRPRSSIPPPPLFPSHAY